MIMRNLKKKKKKLKVMFGICLPFHYHPEIKESCKKKKKIEADANVRVWKELVKNSERYSLFE